MPWRCGTTKEGDKLENNKDELKFTIPICPRTKKNHQVIRRNIKTGAPFVSTSDAYKAYQKAALMLIPPGARQHIDYPVNIKAVYYMQTRRRVDRPNLENALLDILVDAGVLADDNSNIAATADGSRVLYDRDHPRTEVTITRLEGEK